MIRILLLIVSMVFVLTPFMGFYKVIDGVDDAQAQFIFRQWLLPAICSVLYGIFFALLLIIYLIHKHTNRIK